jgi:phosphatidylinositol-4,5-bisphosphate 3-kinase
MWQVKERSARRSSTNSPEPSLKLLHPLQALTDQDMADLRNLAWSKQFPHFLPWYLKSIDLTRIANLICLPDVLKAWQSPKTGDVLALLSPQFLDPTVRQYAVSRMKSWSNQKIQLYMLQLMQALQSEPEIDSPLCLFLLKQAFREPKYLGLRFFWALRSVAHLPWMKKRIYGLTYLFCAFSQPHDRDRYMDSLAFTGSQINLWKEFHPENGLPPTESLSELIAQKVFNFQNFGSRICRE